MTPPDRAIARVFPRRTSMTPDDKLAFAGRQPPLLAMAEIVGTKMKEIWKA